jgi:hypothetical protein
MVHREGQLLIGQLDKRTCAGGVEDFEGLFHDGFDPQESQ